MNGKMTKLKQLFNFKKPENKKRLIKSVAFLAKTVIPILLIFIIATLLGFAGDFTKNLAVDTPFSFRTAGDWIIAGIIVLLVIVPIVYFIKQRKHGRLLTTNIMLMIMALTYGVLPVAFYQPSDSVKGLKDWALHVNAMYILLAVLLVVAFSLAVYIGWYKVTGGNRWTIVGLALPYLFTGHFILQNYMTWYSLLNQTNFSFTVLYKVVKYYGSRTAMVDSTIYLALSAATTALLLLVIYLILSWSYRRIEQRKERMLSNVNV